MTVGSLFSGIGGLDLGLERAGHTVRWQVEANPYCQRILAKHWPHVPCYPDVTQLTGTELAPVDLICGGFPCQPVSHAGLQKGTDDDRWLWPHFARLLGVLRPRYVLLENVPGLLTTNGGHAFGAILADLADSGYDAEWDSLPAAAVGAPHLRYRVFIIASLPDAERHRAGVQSRHAPSGGQAWEPSHASKPTLVRPEDWKADAERLAPSRQDVADAEGGVFTGFIGRTEPAFGLAGHSETLADAEDFRESRGDDSGTRPEQDQTDRLSCQPRRGRGTGRHADTSRFFDAPIGGEWLPEPDVGRVAHGVSHRVDRLKALGNAVVPQMAEWLGERLTAHAEDPHADTRQG